MPDVQRGKSEVVLDLAIVLTAPLWAPLALAWLVVQAWREEPVADA